MKQPSSFKYQVDGATGVGTITLDRPAKMNALTFEVYEERRDLFAAVKSESDMGVIVITGAGRAFFTGGDVHERSLDGLSMGARSRGADSGVADAASGFPAAPVRTSFRRHSRIESVTTSAWPR